ncbi:hypothetical protein Tco_0885938 [Tanacetum coccineum]
MDGNNQIIPIATGVAQDVSSWHTPDDIPLLLPPILGKNLPGRPKKKDHIPSQGKGQNVGIKSLLDVVWITAAHVCVNAAQLELVLLRDFKENMLSVYYC